MELGLSQEEVALRAEMDPGYVEYIEQGVGASPSTTTVYRLAAALETSLARLEGAGFGQPVGAGHPPGGVAALVELDHAACSELLAHGGIGRVVFLGTRGPVALPVNFRVLGDNIVFRTGKGTIHAAVEAGAPMGLEVDRLDETLGEGWSVLASGHARTIEEPEMLRQVDQLAIDSWSGSERPSAVLLVVEQLTGRRIRRHL